jgi:sporulation protein YlmC with PRC-barrel domain
MANDNRDRVVSSDTSGSGRLVHTRDLDDFKFPDDVPDPRGWDVRSTDGTKVGKVEDLLVDTEEGRVRYVEVALDKDFAKDAARDYALVPIGQARLDDDKNVVVELSSTQLAGAPRYDRERVSRDYETSLRSWLHREKQDVKDTVNANTGNTTTDRDAGFYSSPEYDDQRFFRRGTRDEGGTGVGNAARRGANKAIDAVDNVKDRIDGNPASKPGPDPTDRRL